MSKWLTVVCLIPVLSMALGCDSMDADGDGFARSEDCDDRDPSTYPGAPEQCDGLDNDCDGTVDDNLHSMRYVGFDDFARVVAPGISEVVYQGWREGEVVYEGVETYDEAGRIVLSEMDGDMDGEFNIATMWEYDEDGRLLRLGYGVEEGVFTYGQRYEYDEWGRLVFSVWWDTESSLTSWSPTTYFYDDSGRLVRIELDADDDGQSDYFTYRFYDSEDRVEEEVQFALGGGRYRWTYTYDDNGYVREVQRDTDYDGLVDEWMTMEHNEQGWLLSRINEGAASRSESTYAYDADGDLERVSVTGSFTHENHHQYDALGNLERSETSAYATEYSFACAGL